MRAATMPRACLSVQPHVDQFTLSALNALGLVPAATPCNPSSTGPEYELLDLRFIEGEVYHRIDYGV